MSEFQGGRYKRFKQGFRNERYEDPGSSSWERRPQPPTEWRGRDEDPGNSSWERRPPQPPTEWRGRDGDPGNSSGERRPPQPPTEGRGREGAFYGEARAMKSEDQGNSSERVRHPPWLKGKEIGLFYARRNRMKGTKPKEKKKIPPLGSVHISDAKILQIKRLLKTNSIGNLCFVDDSSYSHIEDSAFKRSFLSTIRGNIVDKINESGAERIQIPHLDENFYEEFVAKQKNSKYVNMLAFRKKLPAFNKKEEILEALGKNQILVISGETGCGKTTQVAQFILDDCIQKKRGSMCRIVCTQPRRISAISVAERVADERAERLGQSSGYQIRLEKKLPRDRASICYCTTGVVLQQMQMDPSLSKVSHLILDEIHERNESSDFLITLLKQVIKKRTDLKIILMSATLNSEAFSKYYDNCPHFNIPGFTFPVQEYFLEDVLQRTKFTFEPSQQRKRKKKKFVNKTSLVKNEEETKFGDYVLPYVRELEGNAKYDASVCQQLKDPESEDLNERLVFALVKDICEKAEDNGSILVFMTSMIDIGKLHKLIETSPFFPSSKYILIPLHSKMPTVEQKQIFQPAPAGKRKIIISTNIAETSITIDDVVYVIDGGKCVMSGYDAETNTDFLEQAWVSRANADQRKGRAGRVKPGVCFHLYTKARHMILEKFQKPEILRQRLDGTILRAKILKLGNVADFFAQLMDPPEPNAIEVSLNLLKRIYALEANESLTPLGYHLGRFPAAPHIGKLILFGAIFSCLDPILSVAASLDYKDAFQMPLGKEAESDKKRKDLSRGVLSDHILLHWALTGYMSAYNRRQFCYEYFLSEFTLKLLNNMKDQFMQYLADLDFVTDLNPRNHKNNMNSNNLSLVKAVICAGLYPNVAVAKITKKGRTASIRLMDRENKCKLHPKSVLKGSKLESPLLVFYRLVKSSDNFIHDASNVHPLPIIFFGDDYQLLTEEGEQLISIGKNLKFKADDSTIKMIGELRFRLNWFLEYKINHPGFVDWHDDSNEIDILRAIMELITCEDMGDIDSVEDFDEDFEDEDF